MDEKIAEEAWEAAERALEQARQMPAGSARIEALRRAGQLRYDAGVHKAYKSKGPARDESF